MNSKASQPMVITLFLVMYFPFVFYGMLNVSTFLLMDSVGGYVNYIGAFFNLVAIIYLGARGFNSSDAKAIIVLLLMWVMLILFNSAITSPDEIMVLKNFNYGSMWATHVIFYYIIARYYDINEKRLIWVFSTLFVLSCFIMMRMYGARLIVEGGLLFQGFNASYFIVCLFPWTLLIEKKWLQYSMIAVAVIAVLISMKRTSLIAVALQLLTFLILRMGKRRIIVNLISSTFLLIMVFYLFNYFNNSFLEGGIIARFDRAEDDNMGSRLMIWDVVIKKYSESSLFSQLFGHGCESFLEDGGINYTAHSDYFETLYDYGAIPLTLLILFIIQLVLQTGKILRYRKNLGIAYATSVAAFLVIATSSHLLFIHPCQVVFITAMWGYAIGTTARNYQLQLYRENNNVYLQKN